MFNSTHTLVGISVARTGIDKWTPHALWTAIIAANLPDIDIVGQLYSTTTYIEHHRGITHTLIGVPALSLLLALVMHAISGNFPKHFAIALIAMSTHPALDYLNTYGIRPLLPWKTEWFYGDILFVIDPYVDVLLLVGILLGKKFVKQRRVFILCSLVLTIGYVEWCAHLRNLARTEVEKLAVSASGVERFGVSPNALNPMSWTGFIQSSESVTLLNIDLATKTVDAVHRFPTPPPSPYIEAAAKTRAAEVFRGFARFPFTRVSPITDGYRILFGDARFFRQGTAFAAEIEVDRSLRVTSERMGFNLLVD